MGVRVCGGASNEVRVEGGASVAVIRRTDNEGGKDFSESVY